MRGVIATALLVALAATPTFALWCDARCETAAASDHASHATHAHHSDAASGTVVTAPGSRLQASGLPRNCVTHVAAALAAPERTWTICGSTEPGSIAMPGVTNGPALGVSCVLRPPLLARTVAPLRI